MLAISREIRHKSKRKLRTRQKFLCTFCIVLAIIFVKLIKFQRLEGYIWVGRDRIVDKFPVQSTTNSEARCGQVLPELQDSLGGLKSLFHMLQSNPPEVTNKGFNHMKKDDLNSLLLKQTCMYDTLTRWNQLAKDLNISRWVVHGGSAMGAKCHNGMNPWDDDIDITVLDCTALDQLWRNGDANITDRYPMLDKNSYSDKQGYSIWIAHLIADGEMILIRGEKLHKWYKLMTVREAFSWTKGDPLSGIDIECMSRSISFRERRAMKASKWTAYMNGRGKLYTVPFGPTTIQSMDPDILNRYIKLRYGKESPCQYPFTNGVKEEKFPPSPLLLKYNRNTTNNIPVPIFQLDKDQAQMDFALENWYVENNMREEWFKKRGDGKQMQYTKNIPNLDKIEIDNSISPGCSWGKNGTLKVIGWNAERGTYWDKFSNMVEKNDDLKEPSVILLNEMDIGMARSGNVHTARRLALQLGMNYAYGVEFLELTRGKKREQDATKGERDALSLHGNAILSKCILGDSFIIRDPLPKDYFSKKPKKGINADGYEVRLGGRMGLFARIFETHSTMIQMTHNLTDNDKLYIPDHLPPHFVVGNVHKLQENAENRAKLWNFYGFGNPNSNTTTSLYDNNGIDLAASQKGVIVQGDFGPRFCSLGGLRKMNNYKIHKTFRVQCFPNGKSKIGPLAGDFFCSNMRVNRSVKVTPPCDWNNNNKQPLTLADHAIVSIEVKGNN